YVATGLVLVLGPLIAEARGAGWPDEVRQLIRSGMVAAVLAAGPAAALVWVCPSLLHLIGVPPEMVAAGQGYAHMMSGTVALLVIVVLWRTVLAAHERPHAFVWFAVAALPLKALGNHVFIHGAWGIPALGVTGAGASSLLVAALMAIGLTFYAATTSVFRGLRLFAAPWDPASVGRVMSILRQGVPMGLGSLGEVGLFLIATPLVAMFGPQAMAAHIIALRITGVLYAAENSLGQAASIRIAHALGTGDDALRRQRVSSAMLAAGVLGLTAMAVLAASAEGVPGLFLAADDAASRGASDQAARLILVVAIVHVPLAFGTVALGVLRGHKDWRVPMVTTNASYWCVGLPVVGVLAFGLNLQEHGVWLGLGTGAVCAALCSGRRLRRMVSSAPART
ncbi:MAG: MATE family efflux transporter, partial [Rhodospirillaceae bacterium]